MADIGPKDDGKGYPWIISLVRRGQGIFASHYNQLVSAINRANTGFNAPLNLSAAAGQTASLRLFQIQVIGIDSLSCIQVDGEAVETNVEVAKPFMLRGTLEEHGDVTFTFVSETERTAAATGEADETQVIVPAYEVDDFIIGIRKITGGTELLDSEGNAIQWIDLNIDARAWAKQAA
jgi:hypothetical protein